MNTHIDENVIAHETEIIWEIPIAEVDYVREAVEYAGTRQRPVPWHGAGVRVGYAVLADDAPNSGNPGIFIRRVFYLKKRRGRVDGDRYFHPDGTYSSGVPTEAVDPRTVAPGKRGELTPRARGA